MEVLSECQCQCNKPIPLKWAVRCSKSQQCNDYYSIHCHTDGCNLKNCSWHETCWTGHLPRNHKQAALHVPVEITLQHLFVKNVISSEAEPDRLRQLHERDALARWFNIRNRHSQPELQVYDRFGPLCERNADSSPSSVGTFPSFVSLIGKSGVGKSTLARAMLLLGNLNHREGSSSDHGIDNSANQSQVEALKAAISLQRDVPVTRSGHTDHAADPTTFGVHLYKDGKRTNISPSEPDDCILFADCEGFFAGAAQTNAERLTARPVESSARGDAATSNLLYKAPITAPSYGQQGQQGAELFYARFLYAVSDVIVFVTNEDQNIAHLLVSVLEWAAAAVLHSVNRPPRKTLIIVRNGALGHSQELSDNRALARLYLDRQTILWKRSPRLQQFVREYNRKQDQFSRHIYENRDLYNALFDNIVCCCIPHVQDVENQRDEKIFNQYLQLRTQIEVASRQAREMRSTGWMKYNVSSFSQILFAAFEHFRTSDAAFNFNKATRIGKPSPQSFVNHIANFLRLALSSSASDKAGVMIPDVIALSFVTWSMRALTRVVDPEHIFDYGGSDENDCISMAERCRSALQEYGEKYQGCGYRFSDGELCINGPAATHGRLHLSSLKKEADGEFIPRHPLDPRLTDAIRDRFVEHYKSLVTDDGIEHRSSTEPLPSKIRRVREAVTQKYTRQWRLITSNTTCLACLQEVPENVLQCGHAYCVQCVRELGKESDTFESAWTFEVCSLCCSQTGDNYSHLVREKPRCAGARILTLDGGGVRGIIELALIREVEARLGLEIPFRDYFDLIIGTSTGGIIALAVAMGDRWGSTQASTLTKAFTSFARATFSHPRAGPLLTKIGLGHFVTSVVMSFGLYQALFDASPLEAGLKQFFGKHTSLFGSARTRHHQCSTRVAVIATKEFGQRPYLISSYNRPNIGSCSDFEREDDENKGMRIWEASLATSAAPFYLPPFKKAETDAVYFDGALYLNCPAPGAMEEMRKLWPADTTQLDFLLSIGTGIQDSEVKIPKAIKIGGFAEICRVFHSKLDSENQWQQFYESGANAGIRDRLHRLNPFIDESLQKVTLWQWEKMAKLEEMVARQMKEPEWKAQVDHVADVLLANLFYFEPDPFEPASANNLTPTGTQHFNTAVALEGTVRSRMRHGSVELGRLLDRVTGLFYTQVPTSSSDRFHSSPSQRESWTEIAAFITVKEQVKQLKRLFRVPVRLSETPERASLVLAVRFRGSYSTIPISGFPVSSDDLRMRAKLWD